MKITEKLLLDHLHGITEFGILISDLPSAGTTERIWWNYRVGQESDGSNCTCWPRDRASEISLEVDRQGTIALDPGCANHPALAEIESLEQKMGGDEIPD